MSSKFYFCNTIGDGSEDNPFSPAISQYTNDWRAVDARTDATQHGVLMVDCTITDDNHTLALADTDIIHFDVEDIDLDDPVSLILDRTKLKDSLADQGISIKGLDSTSTLRDVLKSVVRQLLKRQNPDAENLKTHYDN